MGEHPLAAPCRARRASSARPAIPRPPDSPRSTRPSRTRRPTAASCGRRSRSPRPPPGRPRPERTRWASPSAQRTRGPVELRSLPDPLTPTGRLCALAVAVAGLALVASAGAAGERGRGRRGDHRPATRSCARRSRSPASGAPHRGSCSRWAREALGPAPRRSPRAPLRGPADRGLRQAVAPLRRPSLRLRPARSRHAGARARERRSGRRRAWSPTATSPAASACPTASTTARSAFDRTVRVGDHLPCPPDRCFANVVVSASSPRARGDQRMIIGSNKPNGRIVQNKSRLSAIRLAPGTRASGCEPSELRRRSQRLRPRRKAVLSQKVEGLERGDVLAVTAALRSDVRHLGYNALVGAQLIVARGPHATAPSRLVRRAVWTDGEISPLNGTNCTPGAVAVHDPQGRRGEGAPRRRRPLGRARAAVRQPRRADEAEAGRPRARRAPALPRAGALEVRRYSP